jgi:AcrR family transcriptional regulator
VLRIQRQAVVVIEVILGESMLPDAETPAKPDGLRERKRQQTLVRISEAGLKLFLAKGYEATTLDEIAAAAGISRRTFFYYFKSKEDILLALQADTIDAVKMAIVEDSSSQAPLESAHRALSERFSGAGSSPGIEVDRLLNAVEHLRIRRQANYVRLEQAIYEAFCERWPEKTRRRELRLIAMVSAGAMRIAVEAWREQGGKRPLPKCIDTAFVDVRAILAPAVGGDVQPQDPQP